MDAGGEFTALALAKLYGGLDADSLSNRSISTRLRNKLAYTAGNTYVKVELWHRNGPHENYRDPPLQVEYLIGPEWTEYEMDEMGWQDHITTTVTFDVPLLPGPVRLFAPAARNGTESRTDANGETYVFSVSAAATMVNEGEKTLHSYRQEEFR
jgi:hypothetical protein